MRKSRSIDFDPVADHKAATPTGFRAKPVCLSRSMRCSGFGRVSRVAKGADCKSAGLRLRRFESYLSHQPSRPAGASARQAPAWRRLPRRSCEATEAGLALLMKYAYILRARIQCGCSSMVEQKPSKLMTSGSIPLHPLQPSRLWHFGRQVSLDRDGCPPSFSEGGLTSYARLRSTMQAPPARRMPAQSAFAAARVSAGARTW